jgi:hypothetical protein
MLLGSKGLIIRLKGLHYIEIKVEKLLLKCASISNETTSHVSKMYESNYLVNKCNYWLVHSKMIIVEVRSANREIISVIHYSNIKAG